MKEENEYEEVELFTSSNEYEVNEICAILTDNKMYLSLMIFNMPS